MATVTRTRKGTTTTNIIMVMTITKGTRTRMATRMRTCTGPREVLRAGLARCLRLRRLPKTLEMA